MINCPQCNAELTETDVFCYTCGHKIEHNAIPEQPKEIVSDVLKPCPQCQSMPSSANDVFCAECGFRLIPEVQQVQEPSDEIASSEVETSTTEEVVQTEVSENIQETPEAEVQPQPQIEEQPVPKVPVVEQTVVSTPVVAKKKKKGRWVVWTIIILLFLILAGGVTSGLLIHNGIFSRTEAENYVPKSLLNLIPVGQKEAVTTASRYFVVYCFGQFDKAPVKKGKKSEKEKQAVVSDVFTNLDAGSETNDAAEVAFRNAGNIQIKKFSRFSNYFVNSFSTNLEAMKERENIISDLKSKGYKPEFLRVVK